MKHMTLAAVTAALFLAGSARADDDSTKPAPAAPASPAAVAKHENKITPEAKAAFEKMEKVSNSPVKQGLKDAAGTISMDMMGMAMAMKFTFKAPAEIHVEPDANADGPMKGMGSQMAKNMESSLKPMLGIFRPGDEEEYDASLATKDGKEVLSITNFKDGVEESHTDFTLDANGLPASGTGKAQMEMNGQKHEMASDLTLTWEKNGDRYRLTKFETAMTGGGGQGGRGGRGGMGGGKVAITYTYTDIEKFAIATSWKMEVPGGMAFESRMSDLTVNGKTVEIKAPEGGKKDAPAMGKGGKHVKGEGGEEDEGDDEKDEKDEKDGKK